MHWTSVEPVSFGGCWEENCADADPEVTLTVTLALAVEFGAFAWSLIVADLDGPV